MCLCLCQWLGGDPRTVHSSQGSVKGILFGLWIRESVPCAQRIRFSFSQKIVHKLTFYRPVEKSTSYRYILVVARRNIYHIYRWTRRPAPRGVNGTFEIIDENRGIWLVHQRSTHQQSTTVSSRGGIRGRVSKSCDSCIFGGHITLWTWMMVDDAVIACIHQDIWN